MMWLFIIITDSDIVGRTPTTIEDRDGSFKKTSMMNGGVYTPSTRKTEGYVHKQLVPITPPPIKTVKGTDMHNVHYKTTSHPKKDQLHTDRRHEVIEHSTHRGERSERSTKEEMINTPQAMQEVVNDKQHVDHAFESNLVPPQPHQPTQHYNHKDPPHDGGKQKHTTHAYRTGVSESMHNNTNTSAAANTESNATAIELYVTISALIGSLGSSLIIIGKLYKKLLRERATYDTRMSIFRYETDL